MLNLFEERRDNMAVNKPKNDNARIGAVRQRSQFFNERIGLYIKRNSVNGHSSCCTPGQA